PGQPQTPSPSAQTAPKPEPAAQPQAATGTQSSAAAPAPQVTPALTGFGLEDGTPVKLRLTRNLSSGTDKKGDTVDFEVVEDVNVNGILVIPRNGVAWATITEAQPKRRMGRG